MTSHAATPITPISVGFFDDLHKFSVGRLFCSQNLELRENNCGLLPDTEGEMKAYTSKTWLR